MSHPARLASAVLAPFLALAPLPAVAQEAPGFPAREGMTLVPRQFSDAEVGTLLTTLDGLLAQEADPVHGEQNVNTTLGTFVRHLQAGRLTPSQEVQVARHLDGIARAHPARAGAVGRSRRMVTAFMPGKVAPNVAGRDLDGVEFRLSDYRGKVVVLLFSAEWCGICRTLNPYERFMLELYRNWPFAILSVETGSSPEVTRQMKAEEGLTYRSWWDAPPPGGGTARIATQWNVSGFPAVYVLDRNGVIRFVDVRYEDLLKAVRQLLYE
jgi:peroxiredoxin